VSDMNVKNDEGSICFSVGGNGEVEFETLEFEERSTFNEF